MFHVLKSTYLQPPDVINDTRPAHLEWLKNEVSAGRIVLAGRQEDESGAVLITGDIDADSANDLIDRTLTHWPASSATNGCRSTARSAHRDCRADLTARPGMNTALRTVVVAGSSRRRRRLYR